MITEQAWHHLRLIVAHDPATAAEQTGRRNARIDALIDQANAWADKLDAQDLGEYRRGRPLSDRGATARFYHAVAEAHLSRIIKVDLKSPVLRYHIDWKARSLAELMDGKLLLVTNATDLTAPEVVNRYNALADIERGFRVLKSEIEIGPVWHRFPERIRALGCTPPIPDCPRSARWSNSRASSITASASHRATRSPGCRRSTPTRPGCSAHWG